MIDSMNEQSKEGIFGCPFFMLYNFSINIYFPSPLGCSRLREEGVKMTVITIEKFNVGGGVTL